MKLWPQSLFGRTAVTIALTMSLFLVVSKICPKNTTPNSAKTCCRIMD